MIGVKDPMRHTRLKWGLATVLALLVAALVGMYSVDHPQRALGVGVLLVIGLILLDLNGREGTLVDRFRWIPWAWIALLLVTDLRFIDADPRAVAAGAVNTQHLVQIATFGVVAALVVRARGTLLSLWPRRVPKGLLLAWPTVAALSAAWSIVAIYSLVRGLQLLVIAALALLMVRLWLSDRAAGQEIFARTLRLFVQVVTVLVLIGLVLGTEQTGRFTWPGIHAGIAATYVGAAFLALVLGGRSWIRFPAITFWPRIALFGATIFLTQTRGVIAGIVLAVGLALWLRGREKPIARYLGLTYYVVGALMLIALAATQLLGYLSRGESPESITTLTGRVPLWEFAIGQLDSLREWALGFGYGSSRVVLISEFAWAGSAHSTWIELLLGVGLLGTILAVASIIMVGFWLGRRRSFDRASLVAVSLLTYFLMTSVVSEAMVLPGIGFVFLALVHVPALARRGLQQEPEEGRRVTPGATARG